MQSAPPLASRDQRQAAKFGDDATVEGGRASRIGGSGSGAVGDGGEGKWEGDGGEDAGGTGGGGLVYDLLAVVVHRGSAYSGHYHALIRDCLQEVCVREREC